MNRPTNETENHRRQWAAELQRGDAVAGVYALASIERRTRKTGRTGETYLALELLDSSGRIAARHWTPKEQHDQLEAGDVVHVTGGVVTYQDAPQLHCDTLEPADEYDLAELLPRGPREPAELWEELVEIVRAEVTGDRLRAAIMELLDNYRDELMLAPAGRKIHHAYAGGLLDHVVSIARLARAACDHYDKIYPGFLNRQVLMAGVVLHDFCKIVEYELAPGYPMTTKGRLVGHVSMGMATWFHLAEEHHVAMPIAHCVGHLIASHHGRPEWGAAVEPRTPEAHLLHHLDMIDSRLGHLVALADEAGGGWTRSPFLGRQMVPAKTPA